jgi:hypothetical protein
MAEETIRQQRQYLSYLLRLWQASGGSSGPLGDAPLWQASLESAQTGARLRFASLEDLFAFLGEEIGSTALGSRDRAEVEK